MRFKLWLKPTAREEAIFPEAPLRIRGHQVKREAISGFPAVRFLDCHQYRQPIAYRHSERWRHFDSRDRQVRRLFISDADFCMRTAVTNEDIGLMPRKKIMYRRFARRQFRARWSSNELMRVSDERRLRAGTNRLRSIEELPGVISSRIGTGRRRADLY